MSDDKLSDILTRPPQLPDWLVPGMLHRGSMIILAGDPGVGKSILSYTLAVAKTTGTPFLGRALKPGKVLYFDEENARADFEEYFRWVWRGLKIPSTDLIDANLRIKRFCLSAPTHFDHMTHEAAAWQPELIIIDTATNVCQIVEENDNAEASRAIRGLRRVQAASPNATVLILKHAKVLEDPHNDRTIRGAKAWLGEVDSVMYQVVTMGRPRTDGLRPTRIIPAKVRAFGLRKPLWIEPAWTGEGDMKGLTLRAIEQNPIKLDEIKSEVPKALID